MTTTETLTEMLADHDAMMDRFLTLDEEFRLSTAGFVMGAYIKSQGSAIRMAIESVNDADQDGQFGLGTQG